LLTLVAHLLQPCLECVNLLARVLELRFHLGALGLNLGAFVLPVLEPLSERLAALLDAFLLAFFGFEALLEFADLRLPLSVLGSERGQLLERLLIARFEALAFRVERLGIGGFGLEFRLQALLLLG
jgi:hypothetical protein